VLATYTVTSTLDSVSPADDATAFTLREAILAANTNPGTDTIEFNIAGSGVHTIRPASPLPDVTSHTLIDGYSQPGARPNSLPAGRDGILLIELDGSLAGTTDGGIRIFGDSTVQGLVINQFSGYGLVVHGTANLVQGNFFGTDPTGTVALGNRRDGVIVLGSNNTIGGATPAARNLISGNQENGLSISGAGASNNFVHGNFVGTDSSGTVSLGNTATGIAIFVASHNTVGGTLPGEGNLISGNGGHGLEIGGTTTSPAENNAIQGNRIGTQVDGSSPLGNNVLGVFIDSDNNSIGGLDPAAGNSIAFNRVGIRLNAGSTGNAILANSIFSNTELGINLAALGEPSVPGVTPNDQGDLDTGANNLQNFPVLSAAFGSSTQARIEGTLSSSANTTYRLEFFSSAAADRTGFGEGEIFIGATTMSTGPTGAGDFSVDFPIGLAVGRYVSATATDPANNTSEFSGTVTVLPLNQAPVASAGGPYAINVGGPLALNASGSFDADGDALTFSWDLNNDGTFGDAVGTSPILTATELASFGIGTAPGTRAVAVQVRDSRGSATVASTTVTAVVDDDMSPPIVRLFGPSMDWKHGQLAENTAISAPDTLYRVHGQGPLSFAWTLRDDAPFNVLSTLSVSVTKDAGNGPEVLFSTTDLNNAIGSFSISNQAFGPGTYEISLSATDADFDVDADRLTTTRTQRVVVLPGRGIVWENRGDDGFDEVFGARAASAREVIDAAIGDWNRVIANFSFPDGTDGFGVRFSMNSINGVAAVASLHDLFLNSTDGIPRAGSIFMDRGTDGQGAGWWLDPTPEDSAEFDIALNAFAARASMDSPNRPDGRDLYTIISHEIGHALGINGFYLAAAANTGRITLSTDVDPNAWYDTVGGPSVSALIIQNSHIAQEGDTFVDPLTGQSFHGAEDLMNPGTPNLRRFYISNLDALLLQGAFGYSITPPEMLGSFYANLNQSTGALKVSGVTNTFSGTLGSGASDDTFLISRDDDTLVVSVDIEADNRRIRRPPGVALDAPFVSTFNALDVQSISVLGAEEDLDASGGGNDRFIANGWTGTLGMKGGAGSDTYIVSFTGQGGPATILDTGSSGNDSVIVKDTGVGDRIVRSGSQIDIVSPIVRTLAFSGLEKVTIGVNVPTGPGTVSIRADGTDLLVQKNGVELLRTPLNSGTGVLVTGAEATETFEVTADGLTSSTLPGGVTIVAGEGSGDDDTLVITGSTTVTNYEYTTGGPESGTITLDGMSIFFSEFEPIVDRLTVTNRVFTVGTDPGQTVRLSDDEIAGDGRVRIDSAGTAGFESIAFAAPTGLLMVNGGTGDDEIILASLDSAFTVDALIVNAGDGNDSIEIVALGSAFAGAISLDGGAGADTAVLSPDVTAPVSGSNLPPMIRSLSGPARGVRGQPLSFAAEFTGIDPDDVLVTSWQLRNDSGTTVASGSGTAFDFIPTHAGGYTVTFTTADDEGADSKTRVLTIAIAEVQSDPIDPTKTLLAVGGTTGNDVITVSPGVEAGEIAVTLNGVSVGSAFAPSDRIVAFGQAGNDNIHVAGSILLPAWLHGGAGNDSLKGGAGHDMLAGGDGDDLLVGGSGRDLLIGGNDADRIVGNADDDILIGGTTLHDDYDVALAAIMAEWTSARDFDTRRANILGTGSPATFETRQNGTNYLTTQGSLPTVRDDAAKDTMTGSEGNDWFFANLASSVIDKVTDLRADEFQPDLEFILSE
jgi:Ca2+-binding RTX toxin-like protein